MTQKLARSTLAALPLFLAGTAGCGASPQPEPRLAVAQATAVTTPPRLVVSRSAPARRVGDFFVHRFSGSFTAHPLTLTEEVIAREQSGWVVDLSLTQNEQVKRLRVRFDVRSGQAVSAATLHGTRESPVTLSDYEALMARTTYAADVNDGLISSSAQSCMVGSDALDCETKTYKVWVGDRAATLAVVHSSTFADRDVAGELTTDDGKLVYRAELVEARHGKAAAGLAVR